MKRFNSLPLLLFLLAGLTAHSQSEKPDSFPRSSYPDTVYIQSLVDSAKILDVENSLSLCQKINEMIESSYQSADTAAKVFLLKSKASVFRTIGNNYKDLSALPAALEYYKRCLLIAKKVNDKKNLGGALLNTGTVYIALNENEKALKFLYDALPQFEAINQKFGIALCYENLGVAYSNLNKDSSALEFYKKSLDAFNEMDDQAMVAMELNNMAAVYEKQKKYDEALLNYEATLSIYNKMGDSLSMAYSLAGIGNIFNNVGKNRKKAILYYSQVLSLAKRFNDLSLQKQSLEVLKDLYKEEGKYQEAFEMYAQYELIKDSVVRQQNAQEIMRRDLQTGFEEREMKLKAEKEKQAVIAAEESKRQKIIIWSVICGLLLVAVFALFILNRWRVTQKQKKIIEVQKKVVETQNIELGEQKKLVEEKNKDITDSIEYASRIQRALLTSEEYIDNHLQEYFILYKPKDIVSGDFYWGYGPSPALPYGKGEKSPYLTADPITYNLLKEFVEKHRKFPTEAESAMWELLKSKKMEGYKFRRQHIIGQYIADFVCLKKKLVVEIDGLIHQLPEVKDNDEVRTNWLKDNGYETIRIRNEEVFGDTDNVLEKIVAKLKSLPDVVSPHRGDERGTSPSPQGRVGEGLGGSFYFVTADGTGHGVPGAFMSLLGISFLNEIIIERKLTEPDEILTRMRQEIIRALNPQGREDIQDGMDMILLSFKFENQLQIAAVNNGILLYASANRPLWIVRQGSIVECPYDEMPVGAGHLNKQPFTTHIVPLQNGDTIYTFTDGMHDQFGGEKNRKLGKKGLKEILLRIAEKPMMEQKELLNDEFERWKGNGEQTDDVTIIGIRV